jgi:hypothetical protein
MRKYAENVWKQIHSGMQNQSTDSVKGKRMYLIQQILSCLELGTPETSLVNV